MTHPNSIGLADLIQAFVDQSAENLARLQEEFSTAEIHPSREAMRLIHNLRGAAGCYGMSALESAAKSLDEALRLGAERERCQEMLAAIRAELDRSEVGREKLASADGDALPSAHIVAVEDDPSIGLLIRKTVERMGCTVEVIEDGLKALERMQRPPLPDLLLLDLMLPTVSGQDLALALARSESTRNTPILVISAKPRAEVARLTEQLGLRGSLAKPFSIEALTQKVSDCLEVTRES